MPGLRLAPLFLLQLAVILGTCRLLTWAGRRALQPAVVCEMIAGLLLGPSFFGALWPSAAGRLFPAAGMPALYVASQAGLVQECGLSGTRLGTLVLGAGVIDDSAAWILLAAVLARLDARPWAALRPLAGGAAYVGLVVFAVRPAARRLVASRPGEALVPGALPAVIAALALGAWFTDHVGLHAVFGAFMLGAAMPRGPFCDSLRSKVGPATTALLVPVFFAYSGLNARLGLLAGPRHWAVFGAVLLVATAGKGIACALAARGIGEPLPEAAAVGTLMNVRGLMELILLGIGLERGVITPTLFTMLALMAVATSAAATPVFERLRPRLGAAERERAPAPVS